ncbi:MAG: hypothetical protein AAB407_00395 [Patescibacteria group bacterium]
MFFDILISVMYDFILQTSLFVSLGVVIYLLARAMPRVEEGAVIPHAPGFFDRSLQRLPLKKIDAWLNSSSVKMLRKARIFVMRFDNFVENRLSHLKETNDRAEEKRESIANLLEHVKDEGNSETKQ